MHEREREREREIDRQRDTHPTNIWQDQQVNNTTLKDIISLSRDKHCFIYTVKDNLGLCSELFPVKSPFNVEFSFLLKLLITINSIERKGTSLYSVGQIQLQPPIFAIPIGRPNSILSVSHQKAHLYICSGNISHVRVQLKDYVVSGSHKKHIKDVGSSFLKLLAFFKSGLNRCRKENYVKKMT